MGINAKEGIKVLGGKGFIHPLTIEELEFLLTILADAKYKLEEVPRILDITKKLQSEYKLLKEHSDT
jgi:UDP-N-acetylglucosamine enolpyruvyl transferase